MEKQFDNPAKSSPNASKRGRRRKRQKKEGSMGKIGLILTILHGIVSILFLGTVFVLDMLPIKYLAVVVAMVAVFFLIALWRQKKKKGRSVLGSILSIIMILLLGLASFYIGKVNGAMGAVTGGGTYKIDNMVVAVLDEDPAQTLEDAKDYTFGVQYQLGGDDVKEAVETINEELSMKIATAEYGGMQELAAALHDGEVKVIIYNEGYTGLLEEVFEGYEENVRILYSYQIQKEIEVSKTESTKEVSVTEDVFTVYISGIDVYGDISKNSRSDVNILATINPKTRQILLTTTPRDYYVTIPGVSNGKKDKLTHAGIYGIDASIATLENIYETDIDYYARVNFTSVVEIVDALGGVDVYSEYAFTTTHGGYSIKKGTNHMNGDQALGFARERYSLPGGDNQRGKNQQAVIVAMIKKMISPQILMSAGSIIDSVGGNVQTNMSNDQIQDLVKMQLNEGGSWNIYSVAATGTGDSNYTYSMPGTALYVMNPNQNSINEIMDLMKRVEKGELLDGSEVAQ